ncbi:hypothetical protein [Nioella ostreopsis]|uniref:hypothetical protein n=1 Tax=Nioella ostreopsis TaxID=2448479 RepID=UPI000FD94BA8|nr:hypothetical protein [Nioella ostreopsis]
MSQKPLLVLHPGLPKCATSTIQRLFTLDDNKIGSALGIGVIGKEFKPGNGYPEVTKLMYRQDNFVEEIHRQKFSYGSYFYSNEALPGSQIALEAIGKKFIITASIFTVRFPPLQSLSQFNYSGWLTATFDEFVNGKWTSPISALERFVPQIEKFRKASSRILICPTERLGKPLEIRFIETCFGSVPEVASQAPFSQGFTTNRSIGFAFAQSLALEIRRRGVLVRPEDRSILVKLAQNYPLPCELREIAPLGLSKDVLCRLQMVIPKYREFLIEYGLGDAESDEVVRSASRDLDRAFDLRVSTEKESKELARHACQVLDLAHISKS